MKRIGMVAAVSLALTLCAAAAEADKALPGVGKPHPIVSRDSTVPPEPDDPGATDSASPLRIGNLEVVVHGSIGYTIGFGKPQPGSGFRR